ncbi:hypothetical protein [Nocardia carnea]|uniref:hypothetical protein n=1 Tax=Nocardia carnea TaxID=37328 RepID=UPI002456B97B|nr:hypothetical protein [Nocardia carnea]
MSHTATGPVTVIGLGPMGQAMVRSLRAADHLPGKTIVNLSSDTPDETRAAAKWVRARGGRFVAGGVMADGAGGCRHGNRHRRVA